MKTNFCGGLQGLEAHTYTEGILSYPALIPPPAAYSKHLQLLTSLQVSVHIFFFLKREAASLVHMH